MGTYSAYRGPLSVGILSRTKSIGNRTTVDTIALVLWVYRKLRTGPLVCYRRDTTKSNPPKLSGNIG